MFLALNIRAQYLLEEEKENRLKGASDYNRNPARHQKKVKKKSTHQMANKKTRQKAKQKKVIGHSSKPRQKTTRSPTQAINQRPQSAHHRDVPFASCSAFKRYHTRKGGVSLLVEIPLRVPGKSSKSSHLSVPPNLRLYKKVDKQTGQNVLTIEVPASALYNEE